MIWQVTEICLAALLAGFTVIGLMVLFLILCLVMKTIVYVIDYSFEEVWKRNLPR